MSSGRFVRERATYRNSWHYKLCLKLFNIIMKSLTKFNTPANFANIIPCPKTGMLRSTPTRSKVWPCAFVIVIAKQSLTVIILETQIIFLTFHKKIILEIFSCKNKNGKLVSLQILDILNFSTFPKF